MNSAACPVLKNPLIWCSSDNVHCICHPVELQLPCRPHCTFFFFFQTDTCNFLFPSHALLSECETEKWVSFPFATSEITAPAFTNDCPNQGWEMIGCVLFLPGGRTQRCRRALPVACGMPCPFSVYVVRSHSIEIGRQSTRCLFVKAGGR